MDTENPTTIISRNQAIAKSYSYYFTGIPCERGHISKRDVKTLNCMACHRITKNKYSITQKAKETRKNYYKKNLDKILQDNRKYRQKNKVKINDYNKIRIAYYKDKMPWIWAISGAKVMAVELNLPFDLDWEWAESKWTGRCELTHLDFDLEAKVSMNPYSPSLDRINPKLGYIKSNCRFILFGVNALKHIGSDSDMYRIANALIFFS